MSKLVKGVGKVFKKAGKLVKKVVKGVGKVIKKYGKWIALAVAVYFTAGAALAYFGTATLPGFAAGGIFANAATAVGLQAGAGVAAGATTAAATAGTASIAGSGVLSAGAQASFLAGGTGGAVSGSMAGALGSAGTASAMAASSGATGLAAGATLAGNAAGAGGVAAGVGGGAASLGTAVAGTATQSTGWWGGLSSMEKFQVASTAATFAGNLMSKDKGSKGPQSNMGIRKDGTGPGVAGGFNDAFGDLTQGKPQQGFINSGDGVGQTPTGQYGTPQFHKQNNKLIAGEGGKFMGIGNK